MSIMQFNIGSPILDATGILALVTFLVSRFKPFVELLPFARVDSATHDATLQILNILLNIVLTLLIALSAHQLTGDNALALCLQGLAQSAGSEILYQTTTRSGSSVGDSAYSWWKRVAGGAATPAPASPSPDLSAPSGT